MPYDDALADRVREALGRARRLRIEEKRMFGGVVYMVRERMCVSVGKDRIMCRIDPGMHDAAIGRKGSRTVVMKGRPYRGYVYVDAEAVRTNRNLEYWVKLALEYNSKLEGSGGRRNR